MVKKKWQKRSTVKGKLQKSKVRSWVKMAKKNQRSTVKEKWQIINGLPSKKKGKNQRTAVKGKWQKIEGPQSKKNGKKSKVRN